MGECHKYNKHINVPAFQELRLMPTRIVPNDTKVEIKRTIETNDRNETRDRNIANGRNDPNDGNKRNQMNDANVSTCRTKH